VTKKGACTQKRREHTEASDEGQIGVENTGDQDQVDHAWDEMKLQGGGGRRQKHQDVIVKTGLGYKRGQTLSHQGGEVKARWREKPPRVNRA